MVSNIRGYQITGLSETSNDFRYEYNVREYSNIGISNKRERERASNIAPERNPVDGISS